MLIALVVHLLKTAVRPAANMASAGVAAPVLSTIEDGISVSLVLVALLIPALVLVIVVVITWVAVRMLFRRQRRRNAQLQDTPPY